MICMYVNVQDYHTEISLAFNFLSNPDPNTKHISTCVVTESPNYVGSQGLCPLRTPISWGTPSLNFTSYSIFRAKGGQKTINFLAIFMGLSLTSITNIWSAS